MPRVPETCQEHLRIRAAKNPRSKCFGGYESQDDRDQPLTAPAVAPRIIALDKIMYTMITGRIASMMNM